MTNLYQLANLKTPLDAGAEQIKRLLCEQIGLPPNRLNQVHIVKKSVDARNRNRVCLVCQVEFTTEEVLCEPLPKNVTAPKQSRLQISRPQELPRRPAATAKPEPVVVVGAGPAGLFAALTLAEAGVPTLLLERGKPVDVRMRDIGQLRSHGTLDPESNVCFGEGGAGAYTDGKLYTRVKHPYVRWVLKRLVDFQAPADILVDAHPHLGTDKLVRIVKNLRDHIIESGAEIRFQSKLKRLQLERGHVRGIYLESGEFIATRNLVLGIGHSARDTLANLLEDGVTMEPKPFAVGVRAEHPQALINDNQYGKGSHRKLLGAAAYSLTHQIPDPNLKQRGIYSFCMCPGGFIVPSPTEPGHMAINGMSNANRSTAFANSGIVVQVTPQDLLARGFADSPMIGVAFQRHLEELSFKATQFHYAAPAMRISDFIAGKASGTLAPTHFRPKVEAHDFKQLLPSWIAEPLRQGLLNFERKIRGYTSEEANILAVESRTSSPIRITRGNDLQSVSAKGLFPVGEGAGYAGGIVSAAVDGIKAAAQIIQSTDNGIFSPRSP